MNDNENNKKPSLKQADKEVNENPVGYPASPEGEDIYNKYHEEKDINPEEIS